MSITIQLKSTSTFIRWKTIWNYLYNFSITENREKEYCGGNWEMIKGYAGYWDPYQKIENTKRVIYKNKYMQNGP